MKKRLEVFIVFMFISLCYSIILLDRHLDRKIQEKSFLKVVNTFFESYEHFELSFKDKSYIKFYEMLPTFKANENKKTYKLVTNKDTSYDDKDRYYLEPFYVGIDRIKNIFDIFYNSRMNEEVESNYNQKERFEIMNKVKKSYQDVLDKCTICSSKFEIDNKVYNYEDKIAFYLNDNNSILNIEIYDKKTIVNSKSEMNNFYEIEKEFGDGMHRIYNYKNYNFYSLMYSYKNLIICFNSYYDDGSNNICIVYPAYALE